MSKDYESYRKSLEQLAEFHVKSGQKGKRNEATTRLHLIDTLFFECLGWKKEDSIVEEHTDRGIIDYTFYVQTPRAALVVEAKKEGVYFELPAGHARIERPIKSFQRDAPSIFRAIAQASDYCYRRGVQIGAIANGHQIICFLATRTDGKSPFEGNAIVFDSYQKMLDNFLELWQFLSKDGIAQNKLLYRLTGAAEPLVPPKLSTTMTSYPGFKRRNVIQAELQILSNFVIEDIAKERDIEPSFISECYCASGALSQYALVSKQILEQRYAFLFDESFDYPTVEPVTNKKGVTEKISAEVASASISARPILLLGDVGVGKTMFIRYLMNVEAVEILEKSISIYVDFGSKASLSNNLQAFMVSEMKSQLLADYKIDIEESKFVKGVYNLDLEHFESRIYGDLKKSDPNLFLRKKIEFLENKIINEGEHLRESLNHLTKGRKKQIVLFLDNIDQRSYEFQQDAFIAAQEIAANWPIMVFMTLRPRTFYTSKQMGTLSGYHLKAFTISPPRVDEVLIKRLSFAKKITSGQMSPMSLHEKISMDLRSLEEYIDVLLYSFKNNRELIEFIDNISNGDIRIALDIVETFIGSGHVNTEEILKIESKHRTGESGEHYLVPLHQFLRAIIYGDGIHYDPNASIIVNIFDVSSPEPREHFILPSLILLIKKLSESPTSGGFVEIDKVYENLQSFGFTPTVIDAVLKRAINKRLVDVEARKTFEAVSELPKVVRSTSVGIYHATKLIESFSYVDAMIVDTPILTEGFKIKITDANDIQHRLKRCKIFAEYLDHCWSNFEKSPSEFEWPIYRKRLIKNIENIELRTR